MAHTARKPRLNILGRTTSKFVAIGGVTALAYMGIRRLLGGGSEWQPTEEIDEDPVVD
jgi:hypothetical protein